MPLQTGISMVRHAAVVRVLVADQHRQVPSTSYTQSREPLDLAMPRKCINVSRTRTMAQRLVRTNGTSLNRRRARATDSFSSVQHPAIRLAHTDVASFDGDAAQEHQYDAMQEHQWPDKSADADAAHEHQYLRLRSTTDLANSPNVAKTGSLKGT